MIARTLAALFSRKARVVRKAGERIRLAGEELESRDLPSTFLWRNDTSNANWTDSGNWRVWNDFYNQWTWTGGDYPGKNNRTTDDVQFSGAYDASSIVNAPVAVHSMILEQGYTSTVKLQAGLTVTGTTGSFLLMRGTGNITGYSDGTGAITRGTITLGGTAQFQWLGGGLSDLTLNVPSGTQAVVISPSNAVTQAQSVTMNVGGRLLWWERNVQVNGPSAGQPPSLVNIQPGGTFDIGGAGARWGDAGGDTSRFAVVNYGTINFGLASGTGTFVGDFVNWGITNVTGGTLKLTAQAEQGGGTLDLRNNSTVQVTSASRVLGIRNGSIVGQGTIDGNLVLGNTNGTGTPTVSPGSNGVNNGIGTLTVNLAFQITSVGATTKIEVDSTGAFDKIAVGGYAALKGRLDAASVSPAYQPPLDTHLPFLTTGADIQGDFDSYALSNIPWDDPNNVLQKLKWGKVKNARSYDLVVTAALPEVEEGAGDPPGPGGGSGGGGGGMTPP